MPSTSRSTLDELCVNVIRGLAMDAVQKANSGHPGMPMGAAPMAYAVWSRHLRHNPANPSWFDRDRFILSAGHGSMLLYALLHLTGYDLPMQELLDFRQWGSRTPGHPENHLTPGVEMATGPLGQGISTAVGMALAERFLATKFNTPTHTVVDHFTYVLASDGDLMEGVANEAASLAGHQGLGKLIVLYDDNQITIDGATDLAFTEDILAKFVALGWHTERVEQGMDVDAVDAAIVRAKRETERPSLIACRTVIGYGSPAKAGSSKSHGSPLGPDEVLRAKEGLGLPPEAFWVPDDVRKAMDARAKGAALEGAWQAKWQAYAKEHPAEAAILDKALEGDWSVDADALPRFEKPIATRAASGDVINALANQLPTLVGGSADLAGSNNTTIKDSPTCQQTAPEGRVLCFGVREHAMAAALNGMNLHGGVKAFGGTFLIFSDYCRPSLRLAALMECPSIFVFTHDSIGLGEDGPTHQPVEHLAALRAIPNFNVMRPADGNETAACWLAALELNRTPTALALTRQNVPPVTSPDLTNHPARLGAYILADASEPHAVIVATGSEVSLALEARSLLDAVDIRVRVVSMPSWFLFERQTKEYRQSVLPAGVPTISVEAGSSFGWSRYAQAHVALDRFGASAPAERLFEEFGFTPQNVAEVVRSLISQKPN